MSEKCPDCGGDLDYACTPDGANGYAHCWTCWYKEHPQAQIREYKEGQR